jgi:hypothetical protein
LKPTIMCKLTPDAVALLQLIQAKSIGMEEMGELVESQKPVRINGNGTDENHRRRALRSDAGRTRVNGVTVRSYRKGGRTMSKNAILTAGDKPRSRSKAKINEHAKAVVAGMTQHPTLGLPTITRAKAIEILTKRVPGGSKSFYSGLASRMFKYGHIREVMA